MCHSLGTEESLYALGRHEGGLRPITQKIRQCIKNRTVENSNVSYKGSSYELMTLCEYGASGDIPKVEQVLHDYGYLERLCATPVACGKSDLDMCM